VKVPPTSTGSLTTDSEVNTLAQAGRLDAQLCFALYAAHNAVTRVFRPLLATMDLTYPQYLVMLVLWEHREMRLGVIADQLDLAPHAVSPIVDRLAENGLVTRVTDPEDRRVVNVRLTSAGSALEARAVGIQETVRCQTTLDDDQVVALRTTLKDLAERLGTQ
jgi:MarR family transcriptional regulator, organic hydroperoxide resistance regulator